MDSFDEMMKVSGNNPMLTSKLHVLLNILAPCKLDNFLKNRTIKLLEDKLLPDFYHGFFWSDENVHLNYFPTHNGVTVLVYTMILLGI